MRAATILLPIDSSNFSTSSHAAKMSNSSLSSARSTIPRRKLSDFFYILDQLSSLVRCHLVIMHIVTASRRPIDMAGAQHRDVASWTNV